MVVVGIEAAYKSLKQATGSKPFGSSHPVSIFRSCGPSRAGRCRGRIDGQRDMPSTMGFGRTSLRTPLCVCACEYLGGLCSLSQKRELSPSFYPVLGSGRLSNTPNLEDKWA